MIRVLLVPAALAAITLPAAAAPAQQFAAGPAFQSSAFGGDHRDRHAFPRWGSGDHRDRGLRCGAGDRRHHGDRRHNRRSDACDGIFGPWAYSDQDINESWRSDSYNDWWHDRPDRAFPRWVRHNRNCEPERMWWSGEGWHC
jgi:hypothetical protein